MKTIWKYKIDRNKIGIYIYLKIPKDAILLHIDNQKDEIQSWWLVDTDNDIETKPFIIAESGAKLPDDVLSNHKFLATILLENGNYVLHVFQCLKK